jgi:hypothetical protein
VPSWDNSALKSAVTEVGMSEELEAAGPDADLDEPESPDENTDAASDATAEPGRRRAVTRRQFIATGATGAAAAYVGLHHLGVRLPFTEKDGQDAANAVRLTYSTVMRRRDDQLTLILNFYNLAPDFSQQPPVLRQVNTNSALCYYVVLIAPQNLAEQAFAIQSPPAMPSENPNDPNTQESPAPPGQVGSLVAGLSRLAFVVPPSMVAPNTSSPLLFDSDTLLDWVRFQMNVVQNAKPLHTEIPLTSGHKPNTPLPTHTAIEMPWRVALSPSVLGAWAHSRAPVDQGTPRTELWHTRLGVRKELVITPSDTRAHQSSIQHGGPFVDEHDDTERGVRAIWAYDPKFPDNLQHDTTPANDDANPVPFRMSLTEKDRYDIVRLSSDYSLYHPGSATKRLFLPLGEQVNRLILSPFGGWLDSDAHWDLENRAGEKYNSSLLQWRHKSAMLRDNYVRVVRKGYLYPFGHKASLIKVTERKFNHVNGDPNNARGAYLRQRIFIVVTNPAKEYMGDPFVPFTGNGFPFTDVEVTTLVTPNLDVPNAFLGDGDTDIFEPMVGGEPFLFHFEGTDWAGDVVDYRSPVLWVDDTKAYDDPKISDVNTAWSALAVQVSLKGHRITVAPHDKPGDTRLVLDNIELHGHLANSTATHNALSAASQPDFYPTAHRLTIHLSEVTGASGHAVAPPVLAYHDTYLNHGFSSANNPGGVFLARPDTETASAIKFDPDKSGGAMTPNIGIDGMSRHLGPVSGDVNQLTMGTFDPQTVFAAADAKLLGGIHLADILGQVSFGDNDSDGDTKALTIQTVELPTPDRVVTTIDWHPDIQTGGPFPGVNIFIPNEGSPQSDSFDLHVEVISYTDPALQSKSTFTILGEIRDFTMDLFGDGDSFFLEIPFNRLTFRAEKNKKTEVEVDIGDVAFKGALEFVQELAAFLSFGDGNGLTIDTSGDAIEIQLKIAIPSLGVGIFALQNLAISVGCGIPYNGDPVRFEFDFCSRDCPFLLTIMMFNGGGFVGLSIGIDGVEILEFSFEFGAGISLDFGIASGGIDIEGGVYFKITTSHEANGDVQTLDFTAYVKFEGEVEALGIVSVSVELYMALNYEDGPDGKKLSGDAILTLEIDILFFSGSISCSVHKDFASSGGSTFNAVRPNARPATPNAAPPALDPGQVTFADVITSQDTWKTYCDAFAPVGG